MREQRRFSESPRACAMRPGSAIPPHEEREHKRVAAATRAALGDEAFDQAWREGDAMELEEAVRYALNGQIAEGT
jgi:hypothetical protein